MCLSLLFSKICALAQYLVNGGSQDIETGWTFSIGNPDYLSVFQTWNWNAEGAMDSSGTAHGNANQVCIICASAHAWVLMCLGIAIPGVPVGLAFELLPVLTVLGDHAGVWQEHSQRHIQGHGTVHLHV